jgi:hypothetical protein
MTAIRACPDPSYPRGGYALLWLSATGALPAQVTLSVRNAFSGQWLGRGETGPGGVVRIGEAHWQADALPFGPYPVEQGDSGPFVRVGPEIVNPLEDGTRVELHLGPITQTLVWPDDILPRLGPALGGGVEAIARPLPATGGRLIATRAPDAVPDPDAVAPVADGVPADHPVDPDPAGIEPDADPDEPVQRGGRVWPLLALIAVLLVFLAALWWWLGDPQDSAGAPGSPAARIEAPAGGCTLAGITAAGTEFRARVRALVGCGDLIPADDVFQLLDVTAREGDAEALLELGGLYDATASSIFRQHYGIDLGDDPARAADYYARARDAGAAAAEARLAATCRRLASRTDILSREARLAHCS